MGASIAGLLLVRGPPPVTESTGDAGLHGPRIAIASDMARAVPDLSPAVIQDLHADDAQPDLLGGTDLAPPPADLSSPPPSVPPIVPCTALPVAPSCFHAKTLSNDQQAVFATAAKNAGLRLCAGQTLVLQKPLQGFVACANYPGAVTVQTCNRFKLAADALWKANWPIPERVEVRCPSK